MVLYLKLIHQTLLVLSTMEWFTPPLTSRKQFARTSTWREAHLGRLSRSCSKQALVQAQAAYAAAPVVLVLSVGAQVAVRPEGAGPWGLARSARAEASLRLQCVLEPTGIQAHRAALRQHERYVQLRHLAHAILERHTREPLLGEGGHAGEQGGTR